MYYDASQEGLRCVLMQSDQVVTYGSRQLKENEKNYSMHDFELAAVIHALKIWRHYLFGERFDIFTDHKSLRYLSKQKNLNQRQTRWLESLEEHNYKLHYHTGKTNVVADALSRKSWGG